MQPPQKLPIVLAALLFMLAAIAEIATGRSRIPQDDATEQARRAALTTMDEALMRGDAAASLRAWQQAFEAARMNRGWRGLVEVGDARVRIGAETNGTAVAAPRARQVYLTALGRARAENSVDGAVRVAEGFSRLGDREVTEQVLRIAASLAVRSQDRSAPRLVELARGRLLQPPSGLTRATF
jgi:hypothetical protein